MRNHFFLISKSFCLIFLQVYLTIGKMQNPEFATFVELLVDRETAMRTELLKENDALKQTLNTVEETLDVFQKKFGACPFRLSTALCPTFVDLAKTGQAFEDNSAEFSQRIAYSRPILRVAVSDRAVQIFESELSYFSYKEFVDVIFFLAEQRCENFERAEIQEIGLDVIIHLRL